MRKLSRFAAVALLFFPTVLLHAATGDAASVLQHCGTPLSDGLTALDATDGQQRIISYPTARLYFEHDGAGWSFLFSNQGRNTNLNRVQTGALMPCVTRAKRSIKGFGTRESSPMAGIAVATPVAVAPAAPALTQRQRTLQHMRSIRPMTWFALAVLYLLPTIVGAFRVAERLRYLTLVDVLTGWTVIGWLYALLLAVADQAEPSDEAHESASTNKGMVKLNIAA
jgi:hypothetical protein